MYALPGQTPESALADVRAAIAFEPTHISHYQLTIEPNTAFHARPPVLPDDEAAWEMQQECSAALVAAGFDQYEISAWSRPGMQCRHNLNYWRYGDFLGIGAGAHGKITLPSTQTIRRSIRERHPRTWMERVTEGQGLAEERMLEPAECVFEFFLNQLRLRDGVRKSQLQPRTGVAWSEVSDRVQIAVDIGLLTEDHDSLVPTDLGWRFSNEIQGLFLP
jgi:oxygen-independent coproporphyrinogen-3 oxidase